MENTLEHSGEIKSNPIEKLSEGIKNANTQRELQLVSVAIDEALKNISVSEPTDVPEAKKYLDLYKAVQDRSRELVREVNLPLGVIERQSFNHPKYDTATFVQNSAYDEGVKLLHRINEAKVRKAIKAEIPMDPIIQEMNAARQ